MGRTRFVVSFYASIVEHSRCFWDYVVDMSYFLFHVATFLPILVKSDSLLRLSLFLQAYQSLLDVHPLDVDSILILCKNCLRIEFVVLEEPLRR